MLTICRCWLSCCCCGGGGGYVRLGDVLPLRRAGTECASPSTDAGRGAGRCAGPESDWCGSAAQNHMPCRLHHPSAPLLRSRAIAAALRHHRIAACCHPCCCCTRRRCLRRKGSLATMRGHFRTAARAHLSVELQKQPLLCTCRNDAELPCAVAGTPLRCAAIAPAAGQPAARGRSSARASGVRVSARGRCGDTRAGLQASSLRLSPSGSPSAQRSAAASAARRSAARLPGAAALLRPLLLVWRG